MLDRIYLYSNPHISFITGNIAILGGLCTRSLVSFAADLDSRERSGIGRSVEHYDLMWNMAVRTNSARSRSTLERTTWRKSLTFLSQHYRTLGDKQVFYQKQRWKKKRNMKERVSAICSTSGLFECRNGYVGLIFRRRDFNVQWGKGEKITRTNRRTWGHLFVAYRLGKNIYCTLHYSWILSFSSDSFCFLFSDWTQ